MQYFYFLLLLLLKQMFLAELTTSTAKDRDVQINPEKYPRITDEMKLHNYLFREGNLTAFPVANGQVKVKIGLTLNQVVDVEEINEVVVLNVWIRQEWYNPRVVWNPDHFHQIKKINVRHYRVWTPDIYSYANVEDDKSYNGFLDTMKTFVIVESTGKHVWLASLMLRIGCTINVKDFPFDTQNCSFKFGSFTYDMHKLDLRPENYTADLGKYSENVEWELLSMRCAREETLYYRWPHPYSDVTYFLVIKRKPLFLLMNLIFPNILLSFLTVVVYLVPVTAGERSSFVVSLLLAMALFLTSAFSLMPDSSEVIPFFSYFLGMTLLTMFLLTICLCYTLTIHYANASVIPLPWWMRKFVLEKLTPYLGLEVKRKRPNWKQRLIALEKQHNLSNYQPNVTLESEHPGRLWNMFTEKEKMAREEEKLSSPGSLNKMMSQAVIEEISEKLSMFIDKIAERDQEDWNQAEWHTVARTLDTLSFYVFLVAFALILFSCIIRLCMI